MIDSQTLCARFTGGFSVPPQEISLWLQSIVDTHSEACLILLGDQIVVLNQPFLASFAPVEPLVGRHWRDAFRLLDLYFLENEQLSDGEIQFRGLAVRADTRFRLRVQSLKHLDGNFRLVKFLNQSHYSEIEHALQKQNQLFEAVIWSMPNGLLITDEEQKVLIANHNWMEWVGCPLFQLLGKSPARFFAEPQEFINSFHNDNLTKYAISPRLKLITGRVCEIITTRLLDDQGHFFGHLILAKDVSRMAEMEEMLRHSQKMEALGNMACAVAHDFNNILNVIVGFSEHLRELPPSETEWHHSLSNIERAAQSGVHLTRQLLAFSRRQEINLRFVAINELIHTFRDVLVTLTGREILLNLELEEPLPLITADPGQMEQVLLNLCANAKDACEGAGRILIRTERVRISEPRGELLPGEYVRLSVRDWGIGMDSATKKRIFEPFFTTKPEGKGTGMGLATVYGIVKQSQGIIELESEPGQGSCFLLYFSLAR